MKIRLLNLTIVTAVIAVGAAHAGAQTTLPATTPAAFWRAQLPWHESPQAAQTESSRVWQPLLIYVSAAWCEPCRKLEQELAQAAVQDQLKTWVRLHLDSDESPDAVRAIGVNTVPALVILTPAGRVIASENGVLGADELIKWLQSTRSKAVAGVSDELTATGPPDAATLDRIVEQLTGEDPLAREAAVRRLLPHPKIAAQRVVDAFSSPALSTRLAAIDLLEEWRAPVDDLDPWKPHTITRQHLERLKEWAAETVSAPATQRAAPEVSTLQGARRELKVLLAADSEAEAQVVRERLARAGEALLEEVYAQLGQVSTDRERERLTALRYRLVASDRLALGWPGGLERLASTDVSIRHAALDELQQRAAADDHRLLVELFGDSDPFIRERSLRLLRSVGGREPQKSLIALLNDREPNVRAAVLKQLAESPDSSLVGRIVEYIANEQDDDLIVHAVRVLRATRSPAASESLKALMRHANWRVRAEAVEAMHERVGNWAQAQNTDVYATLIELLEDEDGFVASRAVASLTELRLATAAEPLVRAAVKHPELAPDVLRALSQDARMALAALPQIKEFTQDPNPVVRAAAVRAIAAVVPQSCGPYLQAGLRDPDSAVRVAAAAALLELLNKLRPDGGGEGTVRGMYGPGPARKIDAKTWLDEYRSGQRRPKWTDDLLDDLRKLLDADAIDERVAASLALIAMTREDEGLPKLLAAIEFDPEQRSALAQALPWLPWEKRLEVFGLLMKLPLGDDEMAAVVHAMASVPDHRAAEPLWNLLAERADLEMIPSAVAGALFMLYLGNEYYDASKLPADKRAAAVAAATDRLTGGSELQKTVALALLAAASRDDAARLAATIVQDASQPAALRADALQVLLLCKPKPDAEQAAIGYLSDPVLRTVAMSYLASDTEKLMQLRNQIFLYVSGNELQRYFSSSGQPIEVAAPAGLTPEPLLAALEDSDPESSAYAGYLLALLGDRRGWDALHAYWEEHRTSAWNRMVYRAVSALNADDLISVLDQIYAGYDKDSWELREFYWTIRSIKGEKILELRKRIRDEAGMERLR